MIASSSRSPDDIAELDPHVRSTFLFSHHDLRECVSPLRRFGVQNQDGLVCIRRFGSDDDEDLDSSEKLLFGRNHLLS